MQSSPTIQPASSRYSPYRSFRGNCRGRLQSPPTRNWWSPDFNNSPPSHPGGPSIFQSYQPRKRLDYRAKAPQHSRRPKQSYGSQFRRAANETFVRNSVSTKNTACTSGTKSPENSTPVA